MLPQQPQSRHQHGQQTDLMELRLKRLQAQHEQLETPFWAEPLPVPPEVDVESIIQDELKTLVLLSAIHQVAKDSGNTTKQQMNVWTIGEGDEF